jgi:hypothetical protein
MAHSHYVLDLYFQDDERSDRLRREVLRIDAKDDGEALAEGLRVDSWKKTHHYAVRAIQSPARTADKLIYTSPVADPPPEEPAPVVAEEASSPQPPL